MAGNDYIPLDPCYFDMKGIPPPLVLLSWMSQVKEQGEDPLPTDECHISRFRKRGRPKKLPVRPEPTVEKVEPTVKKEDKYKSFTDWISDEIEKEDLDRDINALISRVSPLVSLKIGGKDDDDSNQESDAFEEVAKKDPENKSFPCKICSKIFKSDRTLKNHMRGHSGNLFSCNDCDRAFERQYQLKCHRRIHTGELLTCELCRKGFTTPELLKVHIRRHTGEKPFSCDQCPMSFPSSSNLKQHKEKHDVKKKYLCATCGKDFNRKRSLIEHLLIHGEKLHVCEDCGKRWARRGDLKEHMRVHTQHKPYVCIACNKAFSQSSTLRRHSLIHQEAHIPNIIPVHIIKIKAER